MMLASDEPQMLCITSDNGRCYKAILDGDVPLRENVRNALLEIRFVTESPAMYGETKSVTVPSGGSAVVFVEGTYGAYPTIEGTVIGSQSGNLWGVRIDGGDKIRVNTGTTEGRSVVIECAGRRATVQGSLVLPTLDSDWLHLSFGRHVIENDVGSGDCTVTWTERWL